MAADGTPRVVWVAFERLAGWRERFDASHPDAAWDIAAGELSVSSPDGTEVRAELPFATAGLDTFEAVVADLVAPRSAGVLLVRRGGYAVAYLIGAEVRASKIGRRHVQGRTKAGGWSQQRFARRRENQAHAAFDAAAEHAVEILGPAGPLDVLGLGGDRSGVQQVLADPRLAVPAAAPQRWLETSGDPNRTALDLGVARLRSVRVTIIDP